MCSGSVTSTSPDPAAGRHLVHSPGTEHLISRRAQGKPAAPLHPFCKADTIRQVPQFHTTPPHLWNSPGIHCHVLGVLPCSVSGSADSKPPSKPPAGIWNTSAGSHLPSCLRDGKRSLMEAVHENLCFTLASNPWGSLVGLEKGIRLCRKRSRGKRNAVSLFLPPQGDLAGISPTPNQHCQKRVCGRVKVSEDGAT